MPPEEKGKFLRVHLVSPQMGGSVQSGPVSGDLSVWFGSFQTYQIASVLLHSNSPYKFDERSFSVLKTPFCFVKKYGAV